MVGGLLTTSVALFWQSRIDVNSGYEALWPGFVLMGLGLGLIMSPMSMAAMNSVDRSKAGVASGTLSMFRMIGGTFGVAALGALVAAVGRNDLEQSLPALTGGARERVVEGLGSAAALEGAPTRVVDAAHAAFVDALSQGLTVAAAATLVAAVVAWFLISPKPAAPAPQRAEPAEPAPEALAEAGGLIAASVQRDPLDGGSQLHVGAAHVADVAGEVVLAVGLDRAHERLPHGAADPRELLGHLVRLARVEVVEVRAEVEADHDALGARRGQHPARDRPADHGGGREVVGLALRLAGRPHHAGIGGLDGLLHRGRPPRVERGLPARRLARRPRAAAAAAEAVLLERHEVGVLRPLRRVGVLDLVGGLERRPRPERVGQPERSSRRGRRTPSGST